MRLGYFACAVGASLWLVACSTTHIERAPSTAAEAQFTTLFPYYAEICAVSEFRKKPGFGVELESGMGGHSVLYLNGVCRAENAHYPTIKLCDAGTAANGRGVGLSVNAHYKNANWVATEGRDFFFHGTLKPGEPLTRAAYAATQSRARQMGILDGVVFHAAALKDRPADMSLDDYMYEISIATDYAIGFGRDRYCARVPLDREAMGQVVAFLNGLNDLYKDGEHDFEWDVLRNNCSHVAHNALAAAGVWEPWETGRFLLLSAVDFPVPKNEFVNLMRRTNDTPIDDILALYGDRAARRDMTQDLSLPTRPGALAEAEPAVQQNDVYDTDLRLIFYDDPILGRYQRRFDRIFAEPRYFDLRANLEYFADLYARIERERPPLASVLAEEGASTATERRDLARFYDLYYRYIARERAEIGADAAFLAGVPPSAPPMSMSQIGDRRPYNPDDSAGEATP